MMLVLVLLCWFCALTRTQRLDLNSWGQALLSDGLCRYGNAVECCWGWRWTDLGRCQPHCQQGCKHGECVEPDRCKCYPGYTGRACNQDLNECGLKPRPCKHRCMNTPGSFKCFCQDGFSLQADGSCRNVRTCYHANCQYGCEVTKGQVSCTCPSPGLRLGPDRRSCVDVNECVSGEVVCPHRRKCLNTFGSFICKCHLGFKLTYINGRYTCIDKDSRPFCSLNPSSPKCWCKDDTCKDIPRVTLKPERPRTTTPMSTTATTPTPPQPTSHPTTTVASTTITIATTLLALSTATPTPTIPPTTTTTTTSLTTTTPPTTTTTTTTTSLTTTTPPTTTTTTTTTSLTTTTTPPTTTTTTPATTTTPPPTTTTTPPTTTTTTTPPTTTTPATTTTPPPTTTTTPPTTTTTTTPPTTTTPATTTTPPPTTTTTPPTTTTTTPPTTTTTTPATTTTTTPPTTTTLPPTTTTPLTTTTTTTPPPTTTTTATPPPTSTTTKASTTPKPLPTTQQTTTPSPPTRQVTTPLNKDVTQRQRGDVHIPRQPSTNHVLEFDIELGNTADDFGDDPDAGVLHCSFDQGLCDWISERDGDLHWEIMNSPTGGHFLSVPDLKAGQRSVRGARLAIQISQLRSHGDLCFSFSHWLTGHQVGVLQLFVSKPGHDQRYGSALWSRTGGHGWRQTQVTMTTHSVDRVLLKAERRKGRRGQIAVDDVIVKRGAC